MQTERPIPRITAIATAVPDGEIDDHYRQWAARQISDPRKRKVFERMSARSGISNRFSVLGNADSRFDPGSFYAEGPSPTTARRMAIYSSEAPKLILEAIAALPEIDRELSGITHIVLASCTGFIAPGLDQIIARRLGLDSGVERVCIGFMGCYAGITALRTAAHIVRSQPHARVLTISVELCTLHLQDTEDLESLLAMGQFADGAAAAIVTGTGPGLGMGDGLSATLEESSELITWTIEDTGFVMHLSGAVPGRLSAALEDEELALRITQGVDPAEIEAFAVHPGGKSILDSVERGLGLSSDRLDASRAVLRECGNMSSATILFVLKRIMAQKPSSGIAMAFGPGLALEGFRFGWMSDAG